MTKPLIVLKLMNINDDIERTRQHLQLMERTMKNSTITNSYGKIVSGHVLDLAIIETRLAAVANELESILPQPKERDEIKETRITDDEYK